jgi:hypothetical protein
MSGDWCSPTAGNSLRLTLNAYSVLDYLPKLTEITNDYENHALIMANNITHEKSFLQAPEYIPIIPVTNFGNTRFSKEMAYHINAAAINRLSKWFNFLKENDLYDNTRIILVSDHGPIQNYITKSDLPVNIDQFNPLLMVKDFNAYGEPITDFTFMSNADVPHLSLFDIIENPINPFTGNVVSDDIKNYPLYIAVSGSIRVADRTTTQFALNPNMDYYVHTNIFNADNWRKVTE